MLNEVVKFWYEELSQDDWFSGETGVDELIKSRFSNLHAEVAAGSFWESRNSGTDYLAEVIVLDQFSRNLYRNTSLAFAWDGQALTLAQEAIKAGLDNELSDQERWFLYMPFMHSESRTIHKKAVELFASINNEEVLKYEHIHKDIIDKFGRYPHRNKILGRDSTTEELEYLANNHESFF